jgi:hypothetical protein
MKRKRVSKWPASSEGRWHRAAGYRRPLRVVPSSHARRARRGISSALAIAHPSCDDLADTHPGDSPGLRGTHPNLLCIARLSDILITPPATHKRPPSLEANIDHRPSTFPTSEYRPSIKTDGPHRPSHKRASICTSSRTHTHHTPRELREIRRRGYARSTEATRDLPPHPTGEIRRKQKRRTKGGRQNPNKEAGSKRRPRLRKKARAERGEPKYRAETARATEKPPTQMAQSEITPSPGKK